MTKSKFDLYLIFSNILLATLLLSFSVNGFSASRGLKIIGDIQAPSAVPDLRSSKATYRALIIGNDLYLDPEHLWKPLKRAVSDAKAIEDLLVQHYGFTDVQRVENASRSELLHALRDFSKRISEKDNVLVYYAGHGFLDQYNNKGYWVPVDASGTDHTTFVRNSTIRDELTDISSRALHTLLISDSCFSGTLLKTASRGLRVNSTEPDYLKSVDNKKSVQILTAGGVEYVDDDYRASGHSPFTYFLRSELENNPQDVLTASDLSRRVQVAVSNNVEQEPQMGVLQGAGDEMGEFLFIKVNLDVQGIPKDRVKVNVQVNSDTPSSTQPLTVNDVAATPSTHTDTATSTDTPEQEKPKKEEFILPVQSF